MRVAALVLFAFLAAVAAVVVVAFVMVAPSAQDPGAPPQFLHIQTEQAGAEPGRLTLPVGAVGALLAMAPNAITENGQINLGSGQVLPVDALRDLWAEVQSASGPVTAEHEGAVVRVEKTGEQVTVNAERDGETMRAELPAAVLDAALAADGGPPGHPGRRAGPGRPARRRHPGDRRRPQHPRLDRQRTRTVG